MVIFRPFRKMLIKNRGFNIFLNRFPSKIIKLFPLKHILNWASSDDIDWATSVLAYMDWLLRVFAVLMKLCYRLSRTLNPNPKHISLAEVSLVGSRPIRNQLSYFKTFCCVNGTLLKKRNVCFAGGMFLSKILQWRGWLKSKCRIKCVEYLKHRVFLNVS